MRLHACLLAAWMAIATACSGQTPTTGPVADDENAVRDGVIRFLERRIAADGEDIVALNRLSGEYLERFRTCGDDEDLDRAHAIAERSLAAIPAEANVAGLAARGRAAIALHRFNEARDDGRRLTDLAPRKRFPLEILGDALLELGQYEEADAIYSQLDAFEAPDATVHVRRSRLKILQGYRKSAATHFRAAVESARDDAERRPHVLAWALIREGELAFKSGDFASAEKNYKDALDVRPGDWSALDHLAELHAANRRFEEAIKIYESIVARVRRPDLVQSLGDVCMLAGRTAEATQWHDKALVAYLRSVEAGRSCYDHHLAGFYSDSRQDGKEAVRWAEKDLLSRRTAATLDALAWALHIDGQADRAKSVMDDAMAVAGDGADSHVLYHASLIYANAGDLNQAKSCLTRAATLNPKFNAFHVHR